MNPLLGVGFHWLGGLSSASFYVPYKAIRTWSWEIFWLTGGLFSWIIAPWAFAALRTPGLLGLLSAAPAGSLFWCWFWGAMWGFGGLTFGLTMRMLGLSLGMAVALGLTTVIGTMGPPIFHGTLGTLAGSLAGKTTFLGIALTLIGILTVSAAGRAKERELAGSAKARQGFDLRKGLVVAVFSGLMSGCFAWGLDAGQPIRDLALAAGTDPLAQGLPVLCVVLAGGFTTNFAWCAVLIFRNGSAGEWIGRKADGAKAPMQLGRNYLLSMLGGTLWYLQFLFYSMGESQMGRYAFSSWTLHMASIILFSTLWGFAFREWDGVSRRTRGRVVAGIALLILSTLVIGTGNYLGS